MRYFDTGVLLKLYGSPSDSLTTSRRWDLLEKGNTALHRLDLLGFLPTLRASRPGKTRLVFGPDYPAVADLSESLQYIGFGRLNASHKSANLTESQLYLPEPRADEAVSLVNSSPGKPAISRLHELEMRSAMRQKVGRGELTQTECDALIAQMESDLATGLHERVAVSWPDVFATAEALSVAHGSRTLCRSLDTLHVALALELGATKFCTFDLRQSRMAAGAGAGLTVTA